MRLFFVPAVAAALVFCTTPTSFAFSFEEMARIDKEEQSELLELARKAARSWNFGAAQNYLKQARNKGYAPKDIQAVETLIAQNQSAKAADDDRKRREETERLAREERDRAARQASSSSSSTSSSGGARWVNVSVECVGFACTPERFKVTGGPGSISDSNNSASIHDNGRGIEGQYSFSVKLTPSKRFCSGSFSVSGRNQWVKVNVFENCSFNLSGN